MSKAIFALVSMSYGNESSLEGTWKLLLSTCAFSSPCYDSTIRMAGNPDRRLIMKKKTLRSGRQDLAMADGDPLPALEDFLLDDGE